MKYIQMKFGDNAPDFNFETPWSPMQSFHEALKDKPAVLVFLRYHGCPVCQMEMANLKNKIDLFNDKGHKVFVFLQSSPANIASITNEDDWPFQIVCDPLGLIFRQYGVEPGGIFKYLHPAGLIAGIKAIRQGYKHGKFEGKETQLPAVFAVTSKKNIGYVYYGKQISDLPSPEVIASNIE
ncbi:MAG: redoxin domain-containing protein [Spirochaetota bacterium]|nr:redoxin domain-containing protein [Spirochaetota bacterium]